MNMKNLKSLLVVISMLNILFIAGCSSSPSEDAGAPNSDVIRMAIDTAAGGSLQFRAAEKQGYFSNNGVEARLTNFAMGIDTVNAVLTEQADTGIAADYALLNSLGKGDMVILGTLTRGKEDSSKETQLLVKGDIKSASGLKGKKLGVSKGTVYEYVWAKYLEANKINEKDITYVPYSTPDEAIIGMKKGDIDAVWVSGALTDTFKEIDRVNQLDNLLGAGVTIDSYLLAKRSFVEKNPESLEHALKALSEGVDYVDGHKEETAKLAFEQLKIPEEDALKDLERTNYVLGFTKEDAVHLEDMRVWLEEKGILQDSYKLKEKLALEPLKKALPESVTY